MGNQVATYTKSELITYYIVSLFLWQVNGWVPTDWIKNDIKNGRIVGEILLKPVSFYWRIIMGESAWHSISIFFGFVASATFWFFLQESFVFNLSYFEMIALVFSVIMSIFIVCTMSICVGLIGFWFTEIGTIEALYWAGLSLLGGGLLPLSFIPSNFQTIINLLPFRYVTSFPLEIYFGKVDDHQLFSGFIVGVCWIVILVWIYRITWEKGLRAYKSWGQ
jgi:ABC-2 type transport system permease protein